MRPKTSERSEHRPPAVSGLFYPSDAGALRRTISECFEDVPGDRKPGVRPFGVVCPHAGYVYSGRVAAHSYAEMGGAPPPYAILVGPNHRGVGPALSLSGHTRWDTPLGSSPVSYGSALAGCGASQDVPAHAPEHSLEVQLPMIQHVWGEIPISPVLMSDQSQAAAVRLGRRLAETAGWDRPAFIASSDLTHYAPEEAARRQDAALIDTILEMDTARFYRTLREKRVTACGYGAIAAAMEYCRARGATGGRLLKYDTSATALGDASSVVGYCSIAFY